MCPWSAPMKQKREGRWKGGKECSLRNNDVSKRETAGGVDGDEKISSTPSNVQLKESNHIEFL